MLLHIIWFSTKDFGVWHFSIEWKKENTILNFLWTVCSIRNKHDVPVGLRLISQIWNSIHKFLTFWKKKFSIFLNGICYSGQQECDVTFQFHFFFHIFRENNRIINACDSIRLFIHTPGILRCIYFGYFNLKSLHSVWYSKKETEWIYSPMEFPPRMQLSVMFGNNTVDFYLVYQVWMLGASKHLFSRRKKNIYLWNEREQQKNTLIERKKKKKQKFSFKINFLGIWGLLFIQVKRLHLLLIK